METKKDSSNELLIVGNGFDLQRGLESSFVNFWKKIDADKSIKTDFTQSSSGDKLNFWIFYFFKNKKDIPWWNIEKDIHDVIIPLSNLANNFIKEEIISKESELTLQLFAKKVSDSSSKVTVIKILGKRLNEILKKFHGEYYVIYNHKDTDSEYASKGLLDLLMEHLKNLECLFQDYLTSAYRTATELSKKTEDLLSQLKVTNKANVLDFNYTDIEQIVGNIKHIHGTLNKKNNIIFGIDAIGVKKNSAAYRFTKEARIMENYSMIEPSEILSHDIKLIKFFGHSLAEADFSYFESIFDFLSIYENPVTLVFYYSEYQKQHELIASYEKSILDLMNNYSVSLFGEDNRKSFATKLMLENRLQVRKLDTK